MKEISVDELAGQDSATIIDVREPDEFAAGHAAGAMNVPLGTVQDGTATVPDAAPLYVICQSGRRSALATEALESRGIDAVNVTGGTTAWVDAGHTVENH